RLLSFSFMLHRPSSPPLFPYTTLFRSLRCSVGHGRLREDQGEGALRGGIEHHVGRGVQGAIRGEPRERAPRLGVFHELGDDEVRSEEHTSELQSRENLVCRLLLEKKNL